MTFKCVELLIALIRCAGKPLTKQQLLDAAWGDLDASDATLAQHIFLLRRALRHEDRTWIATIPNVGYCFTADVTEIGESDGDRAQAMRTYLDGARAMREIGSERALRSAIELCTHAAALDASHAPLYVVRAGCWRLLAESMHAEPLPCVDCAQADAQAALARDAQDPDARLEAALCALLERDTATARGHLDALQIVRADHPALARTRVWLALMDGRVDEALRMSARCGGTLLGAALYMARNFSGAREIFDRFAHADVNARLMRGACRLFTGELRAALEDFSAIYHADAQALTSPGVLRYALGFYIYTLAKSGAVRLARERAHALDELSLTRYVSPMVRAVAHIGLGERDRAIALIEQARRRFDPWAAYLHVDPLLDELRADPRFADVAAA